MASMEKFIKGCLADASEKIMEARGKGLKITAKARNDMATSADFASEELIVGRIREEYPDAVVLSEESYAKGDFSADSLFVIDPIDGTHNFIQGIPLYAISIAHFSGGRPTAGGVRLVPQGEVIYAEKGKGAKMNGKRISVSKTPRAEDFFFLSDSRLHLAVDMGVERGLLELERMSQHTRFLGAAVYDMCYVACARADAAYEFRLKPFDFAAAAFIVEEAGGRVTDFEGNPWGLSTVSFLASNGNEHEMVLGILTGKN